MQLCGAPALFIDAAKPSYLHSDGSSAPEPISGPVRDGLISGSVHSKGRRHNELTSGSLGREFSPWQTEGMNEAFEPWEAWEQANADLIKRLAAMTTMDKLRLLSALPIDDNALNSDSLSEQDEQDMQATKVLVAVKVLLMLRQQHPDIFDLLYAEVLEPSMRWSLEADEINRFRQAIGDIEQD